MKPVYDVVSGSILLSKREDFFRLHRDWAPSDDAQDRDSTGLTADDGDWQLWQVPRHLPLRQV